MSRRKLNSLPPRVCIRRRMSIFNRTASGLLAQDGEQCVAVIQRGNQVVLRPIHIEGLVTVARISELDNGRVKAPLKLAECLALPGPLTCDVNWNDVDEELEVVLPSWLSAADRCA